MYDTYNLLLGVKTVEGGVSDDFLKAKFLMEQSGFIPTNIVSVINTTEEVNQLSKEVKDKLIARLYLMLKYKPFEVLVIHDCFTSNAKYGNYLRYWYKEIMAEIAESNMLHFLCRQLPNNPVTEKSVNQEAKKRVAMLIRESEYGLS